LRVAGRLRAGRAGTALNAANVMLAPMSRPNVALQLTIALRIAPAPRALLFDALAAELGR